jgi:hypothetical protein
MTTQNSLHFNVSRSHGWKDALVVSCLAIVLGAFVAQISDPQPMASVSETVAVYG